jgi:hypothetical protein
MRTKITNIYKFDELSEKAKLNAINQITTNYVPGYDNFDYKAVIEDIKANAFEFYADGSLC